MIIEPKIFGRLFLADKDIADYQNLEFLARSS